MASSKVFYSQEEALALAFPGATKVVAKTHVLSDEQAERVEKLSRAELDSRLITVHSGFMQDELLGYAYIDVHTVRTKPEAFMVVLAPDGAVSGVHILAFYEPLDYLPVGRWYEQFIGKREGDALRVGRDIDSVTGATLSTRAASSGVRRVLALYRVLLS